MNYIVELDDAGNVVVLLGTERDVQEVIDEQGDRNLVPWGGDIDDQAYKSRLQDDEWVAAEPEHVAEVETLRAEAEAQAAEEG